MSTVSASCVRYTMHSYSRFDSEAYEFPQPRIPLLPMLTHLTPSLSPKADFALVGAGRRSRVYKRGRYALFDAYRLCGVGPSGSLLVPAYHCRTMLDPAINLGGELLFYELNEDLSPRLESLQGLMARAKPPIKAMLLTHYFGFAQAVGPIKEFCDSNGIALIEDCSHALFNLRGQERLGTQGRYTIASPYKLLPCEEGGLLIPCADAPMPAFNNKRASLRTEIGVLVTMMQRKLANHPPDEAGREIEGMDEEILGFAKANLPSYVEGRTQSSSPSGLYLQSEEGVAGALTAKLLMTVCNLDAAVRQRREHYLQWCEAVRDLTNCRPLFPELAPDCAPYMFPLLIDSPERHFVPLKKLGMPIWRWDEMALSDCKVASTYRQQLFHLPCHQALSSSEMKWMHAAVSKVLRGVSFSASTINKNLPCPSPTAT